MIFVIFKAQVQVSSSSSKGFRFLLFQVSLVSLGSDSKFKVPRFAHHIVRPKRRRTLFSLL